jgi:hypothetical protein
LRTVVHLRARAEDLLQLRPAQVEVAVLEALLLARVATSSSISKGGVSARLNTTASCTSTSTSPVAPAVLRGLLDEPARAALRALLLGREAPGLPWRLELGGGEVRASSPPHPVGPSHPRRRVVLDPTGARVPPLREASRAVATIAAMPRRLGERWRVLAQRLRQPSPSGDFVPGGFALELRVGPERGRVEFLVQAGAPVTRVWIGAAPGTTLPPRHPRDVARAGAVVAVRRRDHWEVELPGWQPDLEQVRAAVAALRVAQLAEPPARWRAVPLSAAFLDGVGADRTARNLSSCDQIRSLLGWFS